MHSCCSGPTRPPALAACPCRAAAWLRLTPRCWVNLGGLQLHEDRPYDQMTSNARTQNTLAVKLHWTGRWAYLGCSWAMRGAQLQAQRHLDHWLQAAGARRWSPWQVRGSSMLRRHHAAESAAASQRQTGGWPGWRASGWAATAAPGAPAAGWPPGTLLHSRRPALSLCTLRHCLSSPRHAYSFEKTRAAAVCEAHWMRWYAHLALCQGLRWHGPTASDWPERRHEPRAHPRSGGRAPGPAKQDTAV
jgi:hypothetical protein